MRTITVKGIGDVSVKPDLVTITMPLESMDLDYDVTMQLAAQKINDLNACLENIGFEKSSVKTTSFNVETRYESRKKADGEYIRVFKGYVCNQRIKVEFALDIKLLALTLNAIAKSGINPEMSIRFTVKNPDAVNAELLRSASKNAKEKALLLCEASGVELGELISIDYNWGELNVYSRTEFCLEDKCMAAPSVGFSEMDIEPDDIDVRDTATFVWEIK